MVSHCARRFAKSVWSVLPLCESGVFARRASIAFKVAFRSSFQFWTPVMVPRSSTWRTICLPFMTPTICRRRVSDGREDSNAVSPAVQPTRYPLSSAWRTSIVKCVRVFPESIDWPSMDFSRTRVMVSSNESPFFQWGRISTEWWVRSSKPDSGKKRTTSKRVRMIDGCIISLGTCR